MSHLSEVFKYISQYRRHGHQIGRKIGDMLEVLTLGAIYSVPEIKNRLHIEPKLYGFSGAGHKVEFAILKEEYAAERPRSGGDVKDPSLLSAFIECKKVGVEQTVNTKFKGTFNKHDNKSFKFEFGQEFKISFAPRGQTGVDYKIKVSDSGLLEVRRLNDETLCLSEQLVDGHRVIFTFGIGSESDVVGNAGSLRSVSYKLRYCKILEVFNVSLSNKFITATLNDCLTGPQTPEKAKQASFVALDVRKLRSGSFDKTPNPIDCRSILILTEFSHWESKSRNMIKACIDTNMAVPDGHIVEAFKAFEQEFGSEHFLNKITKDSFITDMTTQKLVLSLIEQKQGKIFYDIDGESLKSLSLQQGAINFI